MGDRGRDPRAEPAAGIEGEAGAEAAAVAVPGSPTGERDDRYLRVMLLLLISATFFEGYDSSILALILPEIRDTFGVAEAQLGVSRAIIELGLGAAFFLTRLGDRIGRRSLLLWSVIGYTVMTALTAFSWDLWSFTAFQSLSRVFLGAEYAVAVTMIVEEFPADRRGRALGKLLMCAAAGAVAVALLLVGADVVFGGISGAPLGWRTLYLVGLGPLLFLAFLRRKIRETRRFEQLKEAGGPDGAVARISFWEPWRAPYRRDLVLVGTVHLLRSLPLFAATSWFFYYGIREQGVPPTFLYLMFIVAYGLGILGYIVCGQLMERIGRRPTGVLFCSMTVVSAVLLFQTRQAAVMGVLLVLAVFFGLGMAPVLGAMSTELFPTYIRNQSAAWARNVFEIAGFILGPLLVGVLGDHYTGLLGSVGDTVSLLALLFVPCAWLLWRHLPETRGRELEEISVVSGARAEAARHRTAVVAVAALIAVAAATTAAVVAAGGVVRRPEGAAERFLQAMDHHEDAQVREFGSDELAAQVAPGRPEFTAIEVGRADVQDETASVPVKATQSSGQVVTGTMDVRLSGGPDGGWRAVAFRPGQVAGRVPSEGGPPPARIPLTLWAFAVVALVALTAACALLLSRLTRVRPSAVTVGV